jgi:hypothetical protein
VPPDTTITINPSDGGTTDAGAGCTETEDTSTCTFTTDCTFDNAGYTTKVHLTTKNSSGTITGSESSKTTNDADGGVLSNCAYDFTYTKQ